jgi:hypothetical protein
LEISIVTATREMKSRNDLVIGACEFTAGQRQLRV